MNERSPWPRLLAMAVLLAAFLATARGRGLQEAGRVDGSASACERTPPRDVDGLERCLALRPRDVELMLDLGTSYEARNDIESAEAMYRRALSIDWKDADVHVRLGQILLRRGEHADATREGQLALAFQPRSSRALALLERAGWRGER